MNIYDVSRRAGVSIATVSRVLNNNPHVSGETRDRVMRVIEECGYIPNAFARGLGLNTMRTIGLLCPDASDPYQGQALSCLESLFREKGYDSLLICTGSSHEARQAGVENLKNRHVDGIVLMGSSFIGETEEENAYIREAAESFPVALLNGDYSAPGVYCALCDDEKASREAVNHLAADGRTRILHLYHARSWSGKRKLSGYRKALEDNGIPFDEKLLREAGKESRNIPRVAEMLREIAREGCRFDAVFCSEDTLAVGAVKYALSEGLRIPEDLAVAGYNNSPLCLCCEPEITSVENRLDALCARITEMMTEALEGGEPENRAVFEGSLAVRSSTRREGNA